jgi:polycystin 1L2
MKNIVTLLSIAVPAFFVVLYSMQWGRERSNAWLISMFLSFFESLFVIDPIKVFIITGIITFVLRKPDDDDEPNELLDSGDRYLNAIVNHDEEYLHNRAASPSQIDVRAIMRSRRANLSRMSIIDADELQRQRDKRLKRVRVNQILREGAIYLMFLLVVLFLCHQPRSINSNLMHEDLANAFLRNQALKFDEVLFFF